MNRTTFIRVACCALLAAAVPADARRHDGPGQGPVTLAPPSSLAKPALIVDLKRPGKLRDALRKNAWLQAALQRPLGKGYLGSWSAFLGTRGEDLSASFRGAVLDLVLAPLFAQPFRVAWYTAHDATHGPVLIVPRPGDQLKLAYAALDQVARKGAVAARCPGDQGSPGFLIARWTLAEHVLFSALKEDRLLVSRHPAAIVQGYCGNDATIAPEGNDVEISIAPERIGRGAQLGASLLGLGESLVLKLDIEGDRLVPRGLAAPLLKPARLAKGSLSAEMLRLLPATTPVILSLQLNLPEKLDAASLRDFWKDSIGTKALARTATIAWWPRGDARAPQELAIVWSRADDAPALAVMFDGKNHLVADLICNQVVLGSQPVVMDRLRRACQGQDPNLGNLSEAVTRGLRAEGSIGLALQPGRILSTLATDGFWTEVGDWRKINGPAAPPEIEEALRALSTLPLLGFVGTSDAAVLVPRGFGS